MWLHLLQITHASWQVFPAESDSYQVTICREEKAPVKDFASEKQAQ